MEKVSPLISVIVPNYNHEKYLEQRLECIFNQTYSNFEVILLDDCSSDKSKVILLEYAKKPKVSHCVFNDTNSGNTFVQWNKGIALAKGAYIWIAESDDFCELNFLEELIQPFLNDPEIKLVYCQSNRVDEKGKITGSWLNHTDNLHASLFLTNFVMEGNEFIERFLIHKNVIPNASGVLFQKGRAIEFGELDTDPGLKTCGDWLFYLKILTNNKVAFIYKPLNNFRYHSNSVIAGIAKSENFFSIIYVELKMRKKMMDFLLIEKPCNFAVIIKKDTEIKALYKYNRAVYYLKNKKKIKGVLICLTIPVFFFTKSKFKIKVRMMIENFLKSIFK
jgi:glycosyltransferase involved in cell wall biosynthesis